jgi:hypothetical protein
MLSTEADRVSAEMDREFVVFLIGIRIDRFWKVHRWLPVFRARKRMLEELAAHPESGYLSHNESGGISILYWRTFEQLEYFTRDADKERWPAWAEFQEKLERSRGVLSEWRETYVIKPGQFETVYSGTRALGLNKVGHRVARSRASVQAGDRVKVGLGNRE